jgi:hypothetical protein
MLVLLALAMPVFLAYADKQIKIAKELVRRNEVVVNQLKGPVVFLESYTRYRWTLASEKVGLSVASNTDTLAIEVDMRIKSDSAVKILGPM